ncbi:MAG: HDOD domain-containing protein [Methyloprofundus sp.]|nr:HDOD domain-containing protein [Methyloprofundus sp.]
MEKNQTLLQKKLSQPIQLPSLAKNIHILMQTLADENLNYQQIANVIKHYPGITARLLFLANSPWSAPITPIINIEQACARLGIAVVKSLSIAISVASNFDTGRCPLFSAVHFWTISMLVSEGAGLLAAKLPSNLANIELEHTAQTAGILHNLGLLWLADNFPIETDKAFQTITSESSLLTVNHSLRQCTGTDYCEIGGWVAKQMQLPDVLTISMQHHLDDIYQESSWEITLLVGAAANMATALYKQADAAPNCTRLELLGLDVSIQEQVFQKLSTNFEKTHELAKTLFT